MRRHAVRVSILLFLGLACAGAPAAATATATGPDPTPSVAFDLDLDALHVSTVTDTIPGPAAAVFQARAGDPVRRVYLLRNDGLVPLADVEVHDPDAAGVSVHCGHAGTPSISVLAPLSWATCSATFTAVAGKHRTVVSVDGTATGKSTSAAPLSHRVLSGRTVAGYAAVEPSMQPHLSLGNRNDLPPNSTAPATLTITNTGTVDLHGLTAEDTQPLSNLTCGSYSSHPLHGYHDVLAAELDPGEPVSCSATLATSPGTHSASVTIAARWFWARPITTQGPQFPQWLTIRATADTSYTTTVPLPAPVFEPRAATPPSPSPSPVRTSPAAVPPSPSPKPSPPHSPSPTPTHAILFGNPQYPVSRGLPLPLKVLAIVVVPAIAVGRRAAGSLGRG